MTEQSILNLISLKDQVYTYLRDQMRSGEIRPGAAINMDETASRLGVSKTPLRDALIRLEAEGFVTILPRRGVIVNSLSLQDIRNYYQVIGALESTALISGAGNITVSHIDKMNRLNQEMHKALQIDDFGLYYSRNLDLHDIFIDSSGNEKIKTTVDTLKKRLYDFPRPVDFIKEWEVRSIEEHQQLIDKIEGGQIEEAALYIRNVHWSFEVQEDFLKKYYLLEE